MAYRGYLIELEEEKNIVEKHNMLEFYDWEFDHTDRLLKIARINVYLNDDGISYILFEKLSKLGYKVLYVGKDRLTKNPARYNKYYIVFSKKMEE